MDISAQLAREAITAAYQNDDHLLSAIMADALCNNCLLEVLYELAMLGAQLAEDSGQGIFDTCTFGW